MRPHDCDGSVESGHDRPSIWVLDRVNSPPLLALLAVLDVGLFFIALWRPWLGLGALLILLPFNGILLDVGAQLLQLDGFGQVLLASWHDALALGVIAAAAAAVVRRRRIGRSVLEVSGAAVLGFGLLAAAFAPDYLAAAYAYRTLYEPVALMLAVVILAAPDALPDRYVERVAAGVVGAAVVAAAFAWWQVYAGGYYFLNVYYRTASGDLPAAYSATFVNQPRAIGTFHSPNEFGAFLVMSLLLVLVPGVLRLGHARPWICVFLGLALLLTFSRSAWVGTMIGVAVLVGLRWRPSSPVDWIRANYRRALVDVGPPAATFVLVAALIVGASGGGEFLGATVSGTEPSATTHVGAVKDVLADLINGPGEPTDGPPSSGGSSGGSSTGERITLTPLGSGLGTAGPKSTRFTGGEPVRHSEIWFLNYVGQVGLIGLALTALFVVAILGTLLPARERGWPSLAIGSLLALGAGAVFIPVVDEPAVAGTLWSILGIAIVDARATRSKLLGSEEP